MTASVKPQDDAVVLGGGQALSRGRDRRRVDLIWLAVAAAAVSLVQQVLRIRIAELNSANYDMKMPIETIRRFYRENEFFSMVTLECASVVCRRSSALPASDKRNLEHFMAWAVGCVGDIQMF